MLTAATALVIATQFGGDIEEAKYVAEHVQAQQARPPEWADELIGPRKGWKDTQSYYAAR